MPKTPTCPKHGVPIADGMYCRACIKEEADRAYDQAKPYTDRNARRSQTRRA